MSIATVARASVGILLGALVFGMVAPSSAPAAPDMAACTSKDGSTPGQDFPCQWDNGHGRTFTLMYHACTPAELRADAIARQAGHATPLQCQSP